jgi:hypothetical protein
MRCAEIEILLATRRDLSPAQERTVRAHLADCPACAADWRREERTTGVLYALPTFNARPPRRVALAIGQLAAGGGPPPRRLRLAPAGAALALLLAAMVIAFAVLRPEQPASSGYAAATPAPATGDLGAPAFEGAPASSNQPITSTDDIDSPQLYIVNQHVPPADAITDTVRGAVTVLDYQPVLQTRYTLDTGTDIDLLLSPDRSRLYVIGVVQPAPGVYMDELLAVDNRTGRAIWREQVQFRFKGPDNPPGLAVSPDGRWLYIRSFRPGATEDGPAGIYWFQIIDTATGKSAPETIPLPNLYACNQPRFLTPASEELFYVVCRNNEILLVNTRTQQVEQRLPIAAEAAVLSPDGQRMYAVSHTLRVRVVDLAQRAVVQEVDLNRSQQLFLVNQLMVALSGDGTRMLAGRRLQDSSGTESATELWVFDTQTWEEVRHFRYERPIASLAHGSDRNSFYAVISREMTTTGGRVVELDVESGIARSEFASDDLIIRFFMTP